MSELVASVSLRYRAGDDLLLEFTVTRDGSNVDTTGMTARFVVRRNLAAQPAITTEGGTPTATATTGLGDDGERFRVAIPAASTEDLSGTYRFEADLEDGSGGIATVSRGFITFERNLMAA